MPSVAEAVALRDAAGAPSRETDRVRLYARLFAPGTALLAAGLVAAHPDTLTLGQAALAATIGLLGMAPSLVYLRRGAVSPVPLLPLHGVFYAVAFGFVCFFPELNWMTAGERGITAALSLVVAGVLSLYAGYAAAGPLLRRLRPVHIRVQAGPGALRAWAWAFFGAHLALQYVPRLAAMGSVPQLLYPLGWLAIGLLFTQYLRGELPAAQRWAFFGLALPAELFSRFVTGALYEFVLVFAFVMLIYWRMRRRVLWSFLALMLVLFAALNPVKYFYRKALKSLPEDAGPVARAAVLVEVTAAYYTGRGEQAPEIAASSSLNRLAFAPLFAYVVERTPAVIPYWGGQTYSYFLATLVPRALWPEKPSAAFGNEFGHRYGILASGVYDTSINVPWLVEFFVNFGPPGVVLGMALVGALMRLLARKLDNPAANDCEFLLGLTLCFQLFWGESNMAIMWGGLLQTALALYALLWLAAGRFRW